MRRLAVVGAVLVAAAAVIGTAVAAVGYLRRDSQYRQFVEDGERAVARGESYAAIEAFSGAIALRPTSMVAYYRRGEAHAAQKRFDQAIRDLTEAARLAEDAPQPLVALGRVYEQHDEPLRAVAMYERAADKLGDEDPALLYTLALARYRGGAATHAPASAERPLLRALARQDAFPEAHYLLGLVRRDLHQFDDAVASFEAALRHAPQMWTAREELIDLYRQLGRPMEEMRHLQTLAQQDDGSARRVAIALAEARRGQYSGALGTLAEAVAAHPSDSEILLALGRVHLARAERTLDPVALAQAREALEKALGGSARRSEGLALYGRALFLLGEFAPAERILREAVSTTPVDREAFAYLADAAERLGHPVDARDALVDLDALQGDTATKEIRAARARRIGTLSLQAGDARTAVAYLEDAHGGGHTDAGTLGALARARWLTGNTTGARDALARALKLDPTDPELLGLSRTLHGK